MVTFKLLPSNFLLPLCAPWSKQDVSIAMPPLYKMSGGAKGEERSEGLMPGQIVNWKTYAELSAVERLFNDKGIASI